MYMCTIQFQKRWTFISLVPAYKQQHCLRCCDVYVAYPHSLVTSQHCWNAFSIHCYRLLKVANNLTAFSLRFRYSLEIYNDITNVYSKRN